MDDFKKSIKEISDRIEAENIKLIEQILEQDNVVYVDFKKKKKIS